MYIYSEKEILSSNFPWIKANVYGNTSEGERKRVIQVRKKNGLLEGKTFDGWKKFDNFSN